MASSALDANTKQSMTTLTPTVLKIQINHQRRSWIAARDNECKPYRIQWKICRRWPWIQVRVPHDPFWNVQAGRNFAMTVVTLTPWLLDFEWTAFLRCKMQTDSWSRFYFSLIRSPLYWHYSLVRHVILPKELLRQLPRNRLLSESEWRGVGVQQSRGWVHYALHR